jgi:SNF2 family DNA or RNA helicase
VAPGLAAEGHRALIFSQFTDPRYGARAVAERLRAFRPLLYTGDLSARQRDEVIHRFKTAPEHWVLVLSLRAGGQGLNLQEASYVFHFDRWWNPAVERQAEDRSHRLGQSFPVHVYTYTSEATIEEQIATILRSKQLLFDELVDEVTLDLPTTLTAGELFGLFDLVPPSGEGPPGR